MFVDWKVAGANSLRVSSCLRRDLRLEPRAESAARCKHAFCGLCANAGKQMPGARIEAQRVALCGAKNVSDHMTREVPPDRFRFHSSSAPVREIAFPKFMNLIAMET
jgi:hypothetical protein